LISDLYEQAVRLAAVGHRRQERRGSGVPYVAHPFAVARIVEFAGFDELTVIAALLHDLVEDTSVTLEAIRDQFGHTIAETVAGCSEVKRDDSGAERTWEDRKRDHLAALRAATEAARAVVLADKLHNLMSIRVDLQEGRPVWSLFRADRGRVLWYYEAVVEACETLDDRSRRLAEACRDELRRVIALGRENRESPDPEG